MRTGYKSYKIQCLLATALLTGSYAPLHAQVSFADVSRRGSVYLQVGYNTPSHKPSDINIVSGTPGNVSNYKLHKVDGDNSTTKAMGFAYNVRLGYFFDYNQNWAFELCYDPVKYHVAEGQMVKMSGTVDNKPVDTSFAFASGNGYFYNLDGANFLSVNVVRRFQIYQIKSHNVRIDALARAGVGPCMPHTYNSINGKVAEHPAFQLGGWNAGAEAALRLTLMKHVFVEAAYKYTYAMYKDIAVYNGTASQKLMGSQMIFSLGYWFSTTKHNQLFDKVDNRPAPFTIKPIYPPDPEEDMKKIMKGQPTVEPMEVPKAPAENPAPAPSDPVPTDPPPSPQEPAPSPEPAPAPAPDAPAPEPQK